MENNELALHSTAALMMRCTVQSQKLNKYETKLSESFEIIGFYSHSYPSNVSDKKGKFLNYLIFHFVFYITH